MTIQIKLKDRPNGEEESWLAKNIGPRMFYLHNAIGGQGWIARYEWTAGVVSREWVLTFEDERYASFFLIKFPQ